MRTPLLSGVFWTQLRGSGLLPEGQSEIVARDLEKRGITNDSDAAKQLVRRGILTQYQVDRLLEGRSRGFFFDEYKVLDLLGAGGMGWVYRAANTTTNEVVALKVLLDRHKEDRGMLARFQQEARAGLVLHHPNIVRTRATSSAGGMLYMILDFVEGPSLLELLFRQQRLPWGLACDFARQAALGLHHAHQAGWIHRDVKPQNLLVDRNGTVKLLDFGLAMMREGDGGDEFSIAMIFGHECIGTPAFMAPEQAKDSMTADARSDVYGLGCTLFAALTGDLVFPLKNPHDVVKAHQTQTPRTVRELVPEVPQGVSDIVSKMLEKNPNRRFQTAAEAAQALARWSKPGSVEFDFGEVLAERTKNALDKVAELHKSRPIPSGSASSTTRLSKLSSVAQSPRDVQTFGAGKSPRLISESQGEAAGERGVTEVINHQVVADGDVAGIWLPKWGRVLVPVGGGAPIPLVRDHIVIGRSEECDLQIPGSSVSGRHCELSFDGTNWWVTDLQSRNGTRVNGKPILRRQIVDHDVIGVGNQARLRLEDPRAAIKAPDARKRIPSTTLLAVLTAIVLIASLIASLQIGWIPRLW